jgi:hypothetical protein
MRIDVREKPAASIYGLEKVDGHHSGGTCPSVFMVQDEIGF